MQATTPEIPIPLNARAPRSSAPDMARMLVVPAALQGTVEAVVIRDTRGVCLSDAQRLTHFPTFPTCALLWASEGTHGIARADKASGRTLWQTMDSAVMLTGSHATPQTAWSPDSGYSGMAMFKPDAMQRIFGVKLAQLHDVFLSLEQVSSTRWTPLIQALTSAHDDASVITALVQHLPAENAKSNGKPSLQQLGRQWVQQLTLTAQGLRGELSERQAARRIKSLSGRSLREWQTLTRTEALFFAAREQLDQGEAVKAAEMAAEQGFADQAHMSRAVRDITGFSPTEFSRRYLEDESFWMYRLWM